MSLKLIPPNKRRNRYWYVMGRFQGQFIECSTKAATKEDAEKFKARLENELRNAAQLKREPMTFAAAADHFIAFRQPQAYDVRRIERLKDFFRGRSVEDIGQADMVAAAERFHAGAAPATKNRSVLVPLSAVLHYAENNDWRDPIRLRGWRVPPREARPVKQDDARLFMAEVLREKCQTAVKHLFVLWILKHGTRAGETLSAKGRDIDTSRGLFRLYVRKTGDWKTFPLDPEVMAALMAVFPRGLPEGRIFPWSHRNLFRWFSRVAQRAGVSFTPHMARHAVGTSLKDAGAPIKVIMDKLGHRSYRSSLIYQDANFDTVNRYSASLPRYSDAMVKVGINVGSPNKTTRGNGGRK